MEVKLPHLAPIKFLTKILSHSEEQAKTLVTFPEVPTLAMLLESAAQSASALRTTNDIRSAYLVSMKNVKLLKQPLVTQLQVHVKNKHAFENMKLIDFEVFQAGAILASGNLTLAFEESR